MGEQPHLAVSQPEHMSGLVGRVDDARQVDGRMLVYEDVAAPEDFREGLCKEGGTRTRMR